MVPIGTVLQRVATICSSTNHMLTLFEAEPPRRPRPCVHSRRQHALGAARAHIPSCRPGVVAFAVHSTTPVVRTCATEN